MPLKRNKRHLHLKRLPVLASTENRKGSIRDLSKRTLEQVPLSLIQTLHYRHIVSLNWALLVPRMVANIRIYCIVGPPLTADNGYYFSSRSINLLLF